VTAAGGADVATGRGTAVTCPDGVVPPGFETVPNICSLAPRHFQFAGASNLNSGDAHGVFRGETFNRFTGETRSTIRGPIFCVTATGGKAVIGVIAEHVTSQGPPGSSIQEGTAFYVPMLDSGKGSALPDLYGPYYIPGGPPGGPPADVEGQCTLDFVPFMTVTDGHLLVHDGAVVGSS